MSILCWSFLALNNAKSSENITLRKKLSTPQCETSKQERRRDRDFTVSCQVVKLGLVRKYSCSVYYHCQTLSCSLLDCSALWGSLCLYSDLLMWYCDILLWRKNSQLLFRIFIPSKIANHTFTTSCFMLSYHLLPKKSFLFVMCGCPVALKSHSVDDLDVSWQLLFL